MDGRLPRSLAVPLGLMPSQRAPVAPASAREPTTKSAWHRDILPQPPASARVAPPSRPPSQLKRLVMPQLPSSSPPQVRRHRPRAHKPAALAPVKRASAAGATPRLPLQNLGPSRLNGRFGPASPPSQALRRERSDLEELLLPEPPPPLPMRAPLPRLEALLPSAPAEWPAPATVATGIGCVTDAVTSPLRRTQAEESEERITTALAAYERTIEDRRAGGQEANQMREREEQQQRQAQPRHHEEPPRHHEEPPCHHKEQPRHHEEQQRHHEERPRQERQLYREGPSGHGGSHETRQLAEDAERLLAHRRERAAILAAAAEKRMARNMGVVLGTSAAPTLR